MAALAFGLIGAWAAPALGIAASTGWAIGSYLGGAIFRPTVRIEGPRLQDTKVQVSTYGTAIPIVYGAMRIAGNVIDMSDIREHSTAKKQRRKGGGTKYTTYTYEADVAVALCEGEISGVAKIWANGELIYSIAPDATVETLIASNAMAEGFKVYTGSETQMPDATLEALHGAGNVPAYRGIAYVVFSTLWLEKYGNRLPNFEFEVVKVGAQTGSTELQASAAHGADSVVWCGATAMGDGDKTTIYHTTPGGNLTAYQFSGIDLIDKKSVPFDEPEGLYTMLGTADKPCFVGRSQGGIGEKALVMTLDPYSKTYINFGETIGQLYTMRDEVLYVMNVDGTKLIRAPFAGGRISAATPTIGGFGSQTGWGLAVVGGIVYLCESSSALNRTLYRWDAATLAPMSSISLLPTGLNESITADDNNLYLCWRTGGESGAAQKYRWFYKLTPSNTWDLIGQITAQNEGVSPDGFTVTANGFAKAFIAHRGVLYRLNIDRDASPYKITIGRVVFPLGSQTVPLGGIVQDLCGRVGLTAIDKSAIDSTQVAGYVMGRQAPVRGAIEPLQSAYFFDAVESGGLLKFVKRGGAPVASIPLDDLCAGIDQADSGDPLAVVRAQEVDLPQQVTISYSNLDAAYQTSAEIAQRIVTPSVNKVGSELPIAMTATQAARIADAWMYQAYAGRTSMKFKLSREYAALEPCDVVTVTDGVQTFTARITSKMDEGGVYAFEAENENGIQYNSSAQGAGNVPPVNQISLVADSVAELIDTAILRDQDDDAGFYAALAPRAPTGRWGGAVLLTGSLSDPTSELGGVTRMGVVGTILNALPSTNLSGAVDAVQAPNFFDESIFIDVQLNRGELESKSVAEIFNLENAAVIGNEIIQFRDAVLTGDRQYRLTGILRGRRGTEDLAAVSKPAGTRFVLMSGEDGILRPDLGTLGIGVQGGYRAVTIGGIVQQADIQTFTNNARGLKPYAPRRAYG